MGSTFSFIDANATELEYNRIISLGESPEEFSSLADQATVSPLGDRGCISVEGSDALKLLQGQFTCDVNQLKEGDSAKGALCDAKGRMVSSFVCLKTAPESLMLIMHKGLIQETLATLGKYAVFYKCTLTDTSDQHAVFGIHGATPDTATLPPVQLAGITPELTLLISSTDDAEELWPALSQGYRTTGDELWNYLLIQAGEGEVRPETRGEFIPQMLNLQHTDAINFRKGCYTGQEIVARMQYLGKLKRRMYHLRIESDNGIAAGATIDTGAKSSVGTVVMTSTGGSCLEILAVLTSEAAAADTLSIGEFSGSFEIVGLPYDEKFAAANA